VVVLTNQARLCIVLLVLVLFVSALQVGLVPPGLAECHGAFTYLLEAEDGGHYALVGLPSGLRSQYANRTARISVQGTYYPSNPTEYLHPDPNFRGLIYVTQYVLISATLTTTYTNPTQISQTTITAVTGLVTLTPIMVSGILDYTNQYCVTPVLTATPTVSTGGNSTQPIPGFTVLSILLGLLVGMTFLGIRRVSGREQKSMQDHHRSSPRCIVDKTKTFAKKTLS
jgi:hypothetical protein